MRIAEYQNLTSQERKKNEKKKIIFEYAWITRRSSSTIFIILSLQFHIFHFFPLSLRLNIALDTTIRSKKKDKKNGKTEKYFDRIFWKIMKTNEMKCKRTFSLTTNILNFKISLHIFLILHKLICLLLVRNISFDYSDGLETNNNQNNNKIIEKIVSNEIHFSSSVIFYIFGWSTGTRWYFLAALKIDQNSRTINGNIIHPNQINSQTYKYKSSFH